MNDAEQARENEREAQKMSAQVAADMLKRPRSRWILRPLYRFAKWIEAKSDQWLKSEGWR